MAGRLVQGGGGALNGGSSPPPIDLILLEAARITLQQSSSWSGLLPRPDDFLAYPDDVRARMLRWNDAWTVDESRRQDELVKAEVHTARAGLWVAAALAFVCILFAAVFFWRGNQLAGSAFLAMPIMGFVSTLVRGILPSRQPTVTASDVRPAEKDDSS